MTLELLVVGIFGLIVGSFLNVFILRLNTGRSTSGRSGCMSCGAQLTWTELVPVFSFIFLRGRCRSCGSAISHQYWIVELLTAVLFVLVWMKGFGLSGTLFALLLVTLLIIVAVYDLKHTIIPNKIVYTFIFVALLTNMPLVGTFTLTELPLHFLMVLASGTIVALPLFFLWLVSRGKWMGFGDVKLTFGFGLVLGAYSGLMAVMLGFIIGASVGVMLLHMPKVMKLLPLSPTSRRFTMSSEIPFAPFLIAGFILVFLCDVNIVTFLGTFL